MNSKEIFKEDYIADRVELYDSDAVQFVEDVSDEDLFLTMIDIVDIINESDDKLVTMKKISKIIDKLKTKTAGDTINV
jgi:hypothetical protein